MKNFIIILLYLMNAGFVFSQGNTKISINIPQTDTTRLTARIFIEDPIQPINSGFYEDTVVIENGHCDFNFDIKNPCLMTLFVNDKFVTMPGTYYVLIEQKDDLVFSLPPLKTAGQHGFGIANVNISGRGSKKLNMAKNINIKCLEVYKTDPDYQRQSLTYKFQTADRKLKIIDSICDLNTEVSTKIKDIIKAQLYGQQFESLFRSCNRSESDSVRLLFDKYIVKKKRMEVFFKNDIVKYASGLTSYLILSEFKNPVKVGGEFFQKKHKMDYAKIVERRLSKFPEIRDYLLSHHVITTTLKSFDSTTTQLYQFYLEKSDFNNTNYSNVIKTYEETEQKFAIGKPFYNFSLPDSTGKIFSLSDFNGKVLVIDFWFNGCSGCKSMAPVLKDIEKEVSLSKVQFISIGIDNRDYWLKGIGKYSSESSLQLYTNEETSKHPMIQYLNIRSYPRLIVVDKAGKILSAPPDPRSDKKGFVKFIQAYF